MYTVQTVILCLVMFKLAAISDLRTYQEQNLICKKTSSNLRRGGNVQLNDAAMHYMTNCRQLLQRERNHPGRDYLY